MPELPEVEAVRRLLERRLKGKEILAAEAAKDPIVLSKLEPEIVESRLIGATVLGAGRKGKYFWLELDRRPWLFAHLGMSGWVRDLTAASEKRLVSHGKAKLNEDSGRPKFLKLFLEAEPQIKIAFTDGRRLGRIWFHDSPEAEPRIQALGPDAYNELPPASELARLIVRRKTSIKGVLLNQAILSGIGNWVADEVLYHAGIAPHRSAPTLSRREIGRLRDSIEMVLVMAVEAEADDSKYPEGWLFASRWGGGRGKSSIGGQQIRRETVAGRTTAWVPSRQS